ncbi:metallophosphoesterase family protein [Alicyclobacillus mengziensis]|uniref:Phosphoesterase n=1 Tax=Alicyclobacillus mengziensis TaxID=2931921 RepID=A0A9X7VVP4_9BACL|nr:metallophosphoesterase [Alicyclobacillus mengziensis]QSO45941.1 metallophosphoesterase [Alicyclobacillus mengziensis]
MRLCVVSDSHRHRHELLRAVKNLQPLDAILHAGDETTDALWLMERVDWPVYAVAGNWDTVTPEFPLERVLDFDIRILLTHGHKQRVKDGLGVLQQRAQELDSKVIVFGHTHKAYVTVENGRMYLNPGSLASPRGRRERTCALLEIEEDGKTGLVQVCASHLTVQGDILQLLRHGVWNRT